jgi:tetratricopeptide (TPR) repeat protein
MATDLTLENLNQQAIDLALNCKWEEAEELNKQLLEDDPNNTQYLNRLAKAKFELGKYSECKKIYNQVLEIDPYNAIAQKNLKKVSAIKKDSILKNGSNATMLSAALFYEEPGITTLVALVKVAEPQKLVALSPGSMVNLNVKKKGISVTDGFGVYIGAFPDDSAYHLMRLLEGGNKYQVIVKSVKSNAVTVLVRETFRSKKFKNQASFLQDAKLMAYSADNIPLMGEENTDNAEDTGPEEPLA